MTNRIFRSICIVALAVFLASVVLFMGMLYTYFNNVQQAQLRTETNLAAQGIGKLGLRYFDELQITQGRITWVAADGTVLYDTQTDAATMENHGDREEIRQALVSGFGESVRHSVTLTERMLYYAQRLPDGTVVRLSMSQSTVLNLLLGMAQPICVIFVLAVLLSLWLANRLAKKVVRPLNKLNLDDPLSNEGYDELAPLLRRIDSQQRQIKAKSADLRRKQEEFSAVTGHMGEGLVLLGRMDTILSINPAAMRLLGTDENCVGRDFLTVNRTPEVQSLLRKAREGKVAEMVLPLAGGEYRLDASPVCTEGAVTGVVLLLFDVTERERAEQIRREFTANVSHELKTPLHAISGYAELMANGIARQVDMPKFAGNIYSEAQRMIRLVEDIIGLSQLDEGARNLSFEQTELHDLAARQLRILEQEAGQARISLTLEGETAPMYGIPQLLIAVIHNLCDNAIKYNRPGGKVRVKVDREQGGVVLTVADTGIGIPAEAQSRVFERFYRVDKSRSKEVGGTGLGLSIVKHAVLIHGGTMELESTPGVGTTITIHFPDRGKPI